jgi:hypothetical protein
MHKIKYSYEVLFCDDIEVFCKLIYPVTMLDFPMLTVNVRSGAANRLTELAPHYGAPATQPPGAGWLSLLLLVLLHCSLYN